MGVKLSNSFITCDGSSQIAGMQAVGIDLKLAAANVTTLVGNYFAGSSPTRGIGVWVTTALEPENGQSIPANNTNIMSTFFESMSVGIKIDAGIPNTTEIGTNSFLVNNVRQYASAVKTY
jgi:hypothetical protein